jgi:hypothetical protein
MGSRETGAREGMDLLMELIEGREAGPLLPGAGGLAAQSEGEGWEGEAGRCERCGKYFATQKEV